MAMMYQRDAEILFPARVTSLLRNLRGPEWQQLVDAVVNSPPASLERLAFGLMMIRLDGCLTCHADSYRAMRGCTLCAQQTITRFKGSDHDLVLAFEQAKQDILRWQATGEVPASERLPIELP
jgi:hypothetical protein